VSQLVRWHESTREELRYLVSDALLVLPTGTTEQHGPHLVTGTDAILVRAVAERAALAATRPAVVLMAPTLSYGASDHHLPFGGTLSLGVDTFQAVLEDLLRSAAASGCRRVLVLNGHGGNAASCSVAVAEASREFGIVVATALFSQLLDPSALGHEISGHAGVFETALMLALRPEHVRMDRAHPSPGGAARRRARGLTVAEPKRWQELDGYTDRPDEATAELGEQALAAAVAATAAAFEEVADLDR
jgi:creatinine amidohydrolase